MQGVHKFLLFLGASALVFFIAYGAIAWSKGSTVHRPHIVFIIADDMGWNDVSFHGSSQIPTPNIDALAYNGVILNRHYVLPICTPSRTSLLTGRYAIKEGMQGWPLKAGEPRGIPLKSTLLPDYLRKLGYSTNLVGKWHVGYTTENHTPARRGFDTFFGYYNGFIRYFDHSIMQEVNETLIEIGHDLHRDEADRLTVTYSTEYFTDLITGEAEKIIKNNGNEKPLYLQVAHLAVHTSDAEDILEVRDLAEVNATFPYIKDIYRRRYAGMMKALDESVGRVVTALSDAKMLENSIIVFISDNGAPTIGLYNNTGSNYPLRGIKGTLFEGGVRGAACVFSPMIRSPSRVSNQPMHIVDWLPTLYGLAGGNIGDLEDIDGLDQWRTISHEAESPRRTILVNIDEVEGMEAAIIGRHKILKGAAPVEDGYYGVTGNDPSNPPYRVDEALSSATGKAIRNLNGFTSPSGVKALKLREKSTIRCKSRDTYPNCSNLCLFDIYSDPCETRDLSEERPSVVKSLESLLKQYRKLIMPQTNTDVDPCSYPEYFNGTWMPWRKFENKTTCDRPIYL